MSIRDKIYENCDGFSLVETLIAVFILSIVSLISLNVLSSFADANQSLARTADHVNDIEKARSYIRDDLGYALHDNIIISAVQDGQKTGIFKITRGFSEISAIDQTRSSAETVEYFLDQNMLVRRTFDRPEAVEATPYKDYILLRNVDDVMLRFYDGYVWTDNWSNGASRVEFLSPRAVEISWSLKDEKSNRSYRYVNRFPVGEGP